MTREEQIIYRAVIKREQEIAHRARIRSWYLKNYQYAQTNEPF
jgi:hypothetical protein